MKINHGHSVDIRREVKLIGRISSASDIDAWSDLLTSTVELFDRFCNLGGLGVGYAVVNEELPYCQGSFEWNDGNFIYSWPSFPYGITALSIILRMLSNIRQKDESIKSIIIEGTEIDLSHPASLKNIKDNISILPSRIRNVPFGLEILPFESWFNPSCDMTPPIPCEIPSAMNDVIWCWRDVAVRGGFSFLEYSNETPSDEPDMGIDGPIVADDFLEWHCSMTGIPHESINSLINILAFFSKKEFPIISVYIG